MPRLDFLFIPVSGSAGTGESSKALQFIEALQQARSSVTAKVILAQQSPLLDGAGELAVPVPGAPTRHSGEVNAAIQALQPRVVVFDSTARVAQLKAARAVGATIVYIGPRPTVIRRGFGVRRLRHYDELWIGTPPVLGGTLTLWEKLLLKLRPGLRLRQFDAFFLEPGPPPPPEIAAQGPVLFSPGGRDYDTLFGTVAGRVAAATGAPCTVLLGRPELAPPAPGLTILPRVNNRVLLDMVQSARHVVSNGGDFLVQLLCLGHSPVCTPLSSDQGPRIELLRPAGLVHPSEATLEALVAATVADLTDPQALAARRAKVRALGFRNGMPEGVQVLLELRDRAASPG